MKKIIFITLFFTSIITQSQTVLGKWKTIDDKTGKPRSIVEIFEKDNKIYGKIIDIFDATRKTANCVLCPETDKNKPVLGLVIIKGLTKDGLEYNDGKILDPESGKLYKCYIKLKTTNTLEVRGYIGFSLLGRSQTWVRI
jgi:uncharacterized protein (DUF2147 family)